MSWFDRLIPPKIKDVASAATRRGVPQGLWRQCSDCSSVLYGADLDRSIQVCPKCGHHMRLTARARLAAFFDDGQFDEIGADLKAVDVLGFKDSRRYRERLSEAIKESERKRGIGGGAGLGPRHPFYRGRFRISIYGRVYGISGGREIRSSGR